MEEFNMLSKEDQEFRDNIACLNAIGPDTADSLMKNYKTRNGLAVAEPEDLEVLFGIKIVVARAVIRMAKAGSDEIVASNKTVLNSNSTKAFKKRVVEDIALTGGHKVKFFCSLCNFDLSAYILKVNNGLTIETLNFCPNSSCKKTLYNEEVAFCYACSSPLAVDSSLCVQCSAESTDDFNKQVLVVYYRMEKGVSGRDALMVVEGLSFESKTCLSIINNKKYTDALKTVMSGGALPGMGASFRE
jgi:hypothetical protein